MIQNVKGLWSRLGPLERFGLVVGVLVTLALFAFLVWWASRDHYQVLFSDLDPQDGSTMIAELDRMKMPYRLADKGNTILVDQDQVYKTRLQLMGKGLTLKGTVGFEIFNNSEFGITEFAQKVNYMRALQGELARTIMGFDEVKFARVHLVLPENGLFRKGAVKPKASISLTMKDGARLRPEQIVGVQRLVAASVPEIEPEGVTVLDQQGVALSRPLESDSELASGVGKLEAKKQTEEYLAKKAAEVLDRTFGPGKAVVSVDVVLNQEQVKTAREDVLPVVRRDGEAMGVLTHKRSQMQNPQARRDYDMVVPGTGATAARPQPDTSTDVEYQAGRKVEQTVTTPGGISRVSVGIVVPADIDRGQVERLGKVVSMALGLVPERGDAIAIFSMDQLLSRQAQAAEGATAAAGDPPPLVPQVAAQAAAHEPLDVTRFAAVYCAVGAVFLLFLALVVYRRARRGDDALADEAERERTLAQIRQWIAPAADGGRPAQGATT